MLPVSSSLLPSSRRRFVRRLAAAAAGLMGGAQEVTSSSQWPLDGALAPTKPLQRVVLGVGGRAAIYHLPLSLAEQLGFFAAEGLDVQVQDFAGGSLARAALLDGRVDVCAGAYEHTIELLASQRRPCQAFVLQGRAPQITFGVSTRWLPHYRAPADLRGRRIGVSAPGSSTALVAQRALARAGVAAEEVEWVGVGTGDVAVAALQSGAIDALSNTEPVITLLENRGALAIVSDTRTLKGTIDAFGGPMAAGCLYAPVEFLARHPQLVQGLASAVVRACNWLQTASLADLVTTVPRHHLLGDRALYLASFAKVRETLSPDGLFSPDACRTALRALADCNPWVRQADVDLARTYTNRFVLRARG